MDKEPREAASPHPRSPSGPLALSPIPLSLTLGPQAALWPPPLSHQATFHVAKPGPWVLEKKQPALGPEPGVEMRRGVLAEHSGRKFLYTYTDNARAMGLVDYGMNPAWQSLRSATCRQIHTHTHTHTHSYTFQSPVDFRIHKDVYADIRSEGPAWEPLTPFPEQVLMTADLE